MKEIKRDAWSRPVGGLLAFAVAAVFAEHFPTGVRANAMSVGASAVRTKLPALIELQVLVLHVLQVRK